LADGSLDSIFERTKFSTARVAIVKIMAAAINRAFFPLRILSPVVCPLGSVNDLTLRSEKGPVPLGRQVPIQLQFHKYMFQRDWDNCTEGQKKGRFLANTAQFSDAASLCQ
jgi:hypothetical protein